LTFKLLLLFFYFGGEAWNTSKGGGMKQIHIFASLEITVNFNTFAASYLSTQGLNNSCLKSRQRRP